MFFTKSLLSAAKTWTVPEHAAGMRVDRYIRSQISIPPALLAKLLRKKAIFQVIEKEKTRRGSLKLSDRISAGMQLQIPTDLVTPETLKSKKTFPKRFVQSQLPVIYENKSMAIFQKPAGLPCQGGSQVTYSVDMLLGSLDQDSSSVGYRLVHRLDRDTTGALVVAKTRSAATVLIKAFAERSVSKKYYAILQGIPGQRPGIIDKPLIYTGTMTKVASDVDDVGAKPAITKYKVLKTGRLDGIDIALVMLDLPTGRKHQIRAHCAQVLGTPVLGDYKYTSRHLLLDSHKISKHMYLHLFDITVPDADNDNSTIRVKAPFPEFWGPAFKALGVNIKKSNI